MGTHPHFIWSDLFQRDRSKRRTLALTLKENILFSTLSQGELNYLASLVYERIYEVEEPIFEQNDRGLGMYLITQGRVAIKSKTSQEETLVTFLTEGSFFGEIALIDADNVRTASAVAVDRSRLIGFFKPDLIEILERNPAMGVKILRQLSWVLARRLTETTEKLARIMRDQKTRDLKTPNEKVS